MGNTQAVESVHTPTPAMPATLAAFFVAEHWADLNSETRDDIAAYVYAMESYAQDGEPTSQAWLADHGAIERYLLRRLDA